MNAYELATGLENHFKGNFITSESALLLRQQADQIAELEKLEQDFIRVIKQTNPNKSHKEISNEEIDRLLKETKDWYEFARAIIKASRGEA